MATDRTADEKLLERASRGDETAFALLYERHRSAVFRFAYRMLGSVELAEDITHDCFLGLIKQPDRYDSARASLGTYLYAAARNLVLKHFRHHGEYFPVDDLLDDPLIATDDEPLRRLLSQELSTEVRKAIRSLPPLQREALILFEYEELSLAEIAEIVGADVGTVKSRLHRARARIRELLARYLKSDSKVVAVEKC